MADTPPTTRRDLRRHRLAHGLCPTCGKEAAPYYLCSEHRQLLWLDRVLSRFAAAGKFKREKIGGRVHWSLGPNPDAGEDIQWREPKDGDRRFGPRLGRVPVDVEATLAALLRDMGRPASLDEIMAAWGKLREKRKTASLAGDMRALIEAQRRRDERNARRTVISQRRAAHGD